MRHVLHRGLAAALVSLLALAATTAASGGDRFSAERMSGSGSQSLTVGEGWVLARTAEMSSLTFDLTTSMLQGHTRDDRITIVRDPVVGIEVWNDIDPQTTAIAPSGTSTVALTSLTESDASILVVPSVGTHSVEVANDGSYQVESVDAELLEAHHGIGKTVGTNTEYYEYVARNVVRTSLSGTTEYTVSGEFDLYLWGLAFDVTDGSGSSTSHFTGEYAGQADNAVASERHYVFALLHLSGATLHLTTSGITSSTYSAESSGSVAGASTVKEPDGGFELGGIAYTFEGDRAALTDGRYTWSYGEGQVIVRVLEPPRAVSGVETTALGVGRSGFPSPAWALAGFALLGGVVGGGALLAPRVVAAARSRRSPLETYLNDDPHVSQCVRHATHAEARGDYDSAERWMAKALTLLPDDAGLHLTRAIYLKILGRHQEALEHHRRAHETFKTRPDAMTAHNAYEAARAAALLGHVETGLHWLRLAVNLQPELMEDARSEPDFGAFQHTQEFLELVGKGEVEFWRKR